MKYTLKIKIYSRVVWWDKGEKEFIVMDQKRTFDRDLKKKSISMNIKTGKNCSSYGNSRKNSQT